MEKQKRIMQALLAGMLFASLLTLTLFADRAIGQVLHGIILEEISREPVPHALVTLQDSLQQEVTHTTSDSDGIFLLNAPRPGLWYVHVRRIGYTENLAGPYELADSDTLRMQIRVLQITTEMDEIEVEAERVSNRLQVQGVYNRMRQGIGHFLDLEEIEKKIVNRPTELFRDVMGVSVRNDGHLLSSRNRGCVCPMTVVLDGFVIVEKKLPFCANENLEYQPTLDEILNVRDIVVIEVYRGTVGAPLAYSRRSHCGMILIWTR